MDFKIIQVTESQTQLPLRRFVDMNIYGRLTMPDIDGAILGTVMAACDGDHIEIGTAHGGSAILCAYAKKMLKANGHIYTVDPLEGYKGDRTPTPPEPTYDNVWANIELHNMQDRITLMQGYHPPLPPEARGVTFESAFIDGGHDFHSVMADWKNLKDKVKGIILFHDVSNPSFGADTVFELACRDKDWEFLVRDGKIGGVIRKGYEYITWEMLAEKFGGWSEEDTPNTLDSSANALEKGKKDEVPEEAVK